jgi:hypothetical protein
VTSFLASPLERHNLPSRVISGEDLGRPRHAEAELTQRGRKLEAIGRDVNDPVPNLELGYVFDEGAHADQTSLQPGRGIVPCSARSMSQVREFIFAGTLA